MFQVFRSITELIVSIRKAYQKLHVKAHVQTGPLLGSMVKGNYISTIPNVVPLQFTSKHVPFCSYLGLIFPFSHNPVLWRNAGLSQLCVLSQPSCVDLTRQSQTCWRQPPDVIHSPRRALPSLADSPPSPVHQRRGEQRRRSEIRLADRLCHSPTWPLPSSRVWLEKNK